MCVCANMHYVHMCGQRTTCGVSFPFCHADPDTGRYAEPSHPAIFFRFANTPSCAQVLRKYFSLALSGFQSLLEFKCRLSLKVPLCSGSLPWLFQASICPCCWASGLATACCQVAPVRVLFPSLICPMPTDNLLETPALRVVCCPGMSVLTLL